MRCLFFESLARVDLQRYSSAIADLDIVMKYCKKEGAKGAKKGMVGKLMGWIKGGKGRGSGGDEVSRDAAETLCEQLGSNNNEERESTLNILLENSMMVTSALKDVVSMQEKQKQVLSQLARNTHAKFENAKEKVGKLEKGGSNFNYNQTYNNGSFGALSVNNSMASTRRDEISRYSPESTSSSLTSPNFFARKAKSTNKSVSPVSN